MTLSSNLNPLPVGSNFKSGSLRSLEERDVPLMLEWMHDPDVAGKFQFDFASMDEAAAASFIRSSWNDVESLHLAIAPEGEYLGTVSLKHVDVSNLCAEYAIATRASAHGTGAALAATRDVLVLAFGPLGLNRVYLDVRADNSRARAFYRKVGFVEEGIARSSLRVAEGFVDLVWLSILASEFKTSRPVHGGAFR